MSSDDLFSWKPSMAEAREARDEGMALVEKNAGEVFRDRALVLIPSLLVDGPMCCEDLVDLCKEQGVIPHNDRAFGPVFLSLMRQGVIIKDGSRPRRKGHSAPGATIWKLSNYAQAA